MKPTIALQTSVVHLIGIQMTSLKGLDLYSSTCRLYHVSVICRDSTLCSKVLIETGTDPPYE